jgi:hypothetical protein
VKAPEPTSTGKQDLELRDTWQRRSSPQQGGEVQGHGTRGSAGSHIGRETRSGATGLVAASEPTSAGRCGPKLQGTWQRVDARPTPCLDLKLVCEHPVCKYRQLHSKKLMSFDHAPTDTLSYNGASS